MTIEQCDVLIVGAGPVGLMLALMLHAKGVDVKIVERQKALYPLPRAVALDHESRRLFGTVGLATEIGDILDGCIGKGGEDGTNFVWRDANLKLLADLQFEASTRSGHPFAGAFSQPELEGLLEKAVLDRKIPLIRGYALTGLEQYSDRVEATFEDFVFTPISTGNKTGIMVNGLLTNGKSGSPSAPSSPGDAPPSIRASYVVGCDGANSTVRRLVDFPVEDLSFQNDWLITDLILKNGYVPPRVAKLGSAQICDPTRPTTVVYAGKGRRRFEFMRLPGESAEDLLEDKMLWDLLEPWGYKPDNCTLERKVVYTFKARWATEFFKGRVTLAGDSLHLMPPFIGQGLNSGFRDAAALGWRLPLILSGTACPQRLLQSYQNERLEHIQKLTRYCIKLGEVICETDPVKSKAIHEAMRAAPVPRQYDPPLGRPGVLTSQSEAGHLGLQRQLKVKPDAQDQPLFDDVHGYGWILLTYGDKPAEDKLSAESRSFFLDQLKGKRVHITPDEDLTGEYRDWFAGDMGLHDAVIVRPDFYVFGHAPVTGVDDLVQELRTKIGAA